MRMQVGNERTRPFLIRMKAPVPALYKDSIPAIKERTIAEAMEFETKNYLARFSEPFKERNEENNLFVGQEEVNGFELFVEDDNEHLREEEFSINLENSDVLNGKEEVTSDDGWSFIKKCFQSAKNRN